jgi:dCMP deaminase
MNNNHSKYMALAKSVADIFSTDESRKTGCVFVDTRGNISAIGYNDFPRGVFRTEARSARPEKYLWMEHAERKAIYAAASSGTSLIGTNAYVPWFPCMDCARALVAVGIDTLLCYKPDFNDPKWGSEFVSVVQMLAEAGITVVYEAGDIGVAK